MVARSIREEDEEEARREDEAGAEEAGRVGEEKERGE